MVAQSREDRIYHGVEAIVEALTAGAVAGNPSRSGADVIALLVEVGVNEAVKRGNRAAGVVQAARVPEAAVAEVVAAEGAPVVVVADGKNWVKMFNNINYKFDGGKGDVY